MNEERRNINRGFKKFIVWQDSVSLYIIACEILVKGPFALKKVSANAIAMQLAVFPEISQKDIADAA
jgi:hypothetical protein